MNPFARSTVAALLLCAACSERDAVTANPERAGDAPESSTRANEPRPEDASAMKATLAAQAPHEDSTGSRHPKKSAR